MSSKSLRKWLPSVYFKISESVCRSSIFRSKKVHEDYFHFSGLISHGPGAREKFILAAWTPRQNTITFTGFFARFCVCAYIF